MPKTLLTPASLAVTAVLAAPPAAGEVIYGLTTQNSIVVIDSATPTESLDGGFVRGLEAGETLLDIDYRAGTDEIYAIGSFDNVYTLDPDTFAASLVGNFAPPSLRGTSFAFDFNNAFAGPDNPNPSATDIGRFARIISDTDTNRVIDGDTGQYLGTPDKTDVFYAAGDINAGADPDIVGIAYTNAVPQAGSTQQYGIDRNTGALVTVANNAGTLETVGLLGVLGFSNEAALDIAGDNDFAFAVLQNSPNSSLYSVDLATGLATELGVFASGDIIRSLTAVPEPAAASTLALAALALLRRRK